MTTQQFSYQHRDRMYTISLHRLDDGRYRAVIDGREYTVRAARNPDGGWTLMLDDVQRATAYVAAGGDVRYVKVSGAPPVRLNVSGGRESGRKRRGGGGESDGSLTAQMPGQVVEVFVSAGDAVSAGQTLALLEAMKMEIRVVAPLDGIVAEVMIVKGQVVERDQLLLTMRRPD